MVETLFPVKIYKTTYQDSLTDLMAELQPFIDEFYGLAVQNNQGSMRGEGVCSYVAKRDLHKLDQFKPVVDFIEKHCAIYYKELGYSDAYKVRIEDMWFNVYKQDSFIDIHNHAPTLMTASFYLQKETGIANIMFENPLATMMKYLPYHIDRNNYHTLFEQEVDSESGDLVIFPGWLNHRTMPNTGTTDRIMIGVNVICTG